LSLHVVLSKHFADVTSLFGCASHNIRCVCCHEHGHQIWVYDGDNRCFVAEKRAVLPAQAQVRLHGLQSLCLRRDGWQPFSVLQQSVPEERRPTGAKPMSAPTVLFYSMPLNKFPTSGVAGAIYYANDVPALYLCCGGSAYFPLAGLLPSGMTLQQDSNASAICGYNIDNPTVEPEDGIILQYDATSKTWKQVALPSGGVTEQECQEIAQGTSIAMAIALG
jgi:hypothetical protein